jgi:hypothetical protein
VARSPKSDPTVEGDLQDAVRQLTGYLQETPLATAALLTLALAIGAGASSVGRPGSGTAVLPVEAGRAPVQRRSRRRKGLGIAAFELDQKGPDGRRTGIDFTWAGPKAKPGLAAPEPSRSESRIGVALFEFFHSRPGGKDTAIKFGWSKEPLGPTPPKPTPTK